MRYFAFYLALMVSALSAQSFAADGSSGCGPGWYILKENSLLSSLGRGTTHYVLFPSVSLGMTFGTSNCSKHSLVDADKQSLHFATRSFDILKQDMARGQGQHLEAYLATFGCDAPARDELSYMIQDSFAKNLMLSAQPIAMVELTNELIQSSSKLSLACS